MGSRHRKSELLDSALALHGEGFSYPEIGERLGVKQKTIADWITDPNGDKKRARNQARRPDRICEECGKRSGWKYTSTALCNECRLERKAESMRAWVLSSIRRWAAEYGEPPKARDWNPAQARSEGQYGRAEIYERGDWPSVSLVVERFGSWNTGIIAAGFTPRSGGGFRQHPKPPALKVIGIEPTEAQNAALDALQSKGDCESWVERCSTGIVMTVICDGKRYRFDEDGGEERP